MMDSQAKLIHSRIWDLISDYVPVVNSRVPLTASVSFTGIWNSPWRISRMSWMPLKTISL